MLVVVSKKEIINKDNEKENKRFFIRMFKARAIIINNKNIKINAVDLEAMAIIIKFFLIIKG